MTEVSTWTSPAAVAARDLSYGEVADLDRLRAVLASAVDRTDPRAISWLWDSMVAAHGGRTAPAGFVEAVATALGDLLAVHVPGTRWSVWPGPDGPTLGVASDVRPYAPVVPFLDAADRWSHRAQAWILDYLTRAAAHLAAAAVPQQRAALDDEPALPRRDAWTAADQAAAAPAVPVPAVAPETTFVEPAYSQTTYAEPAYDEPAHATPEDVAPEPAVAPEAAEPEAVDAEPTYAEPILAVPAYAEPTPVVEPEPVHAEATYAEPTLATPAYVEPTPAVAPVPAFAYAEPRLAEPAFQPVLAEPTPVQPAPVAAPPAFVADVPLEAFALDALDHAMALLRETGAFDREVFVLLLDGAGRRTESCPGDAGQARFRARELVRSSGAARAAITWIERNPVDLPGPRQLFPAVVVDAWDAGAEGIRVGRRFVDDVLGTGPLGGRLVVGPIAPLL